MTSILSQISGFLFPGTEPSAAPRRNPPDAIRLPAIRHYRELVALSDCLYALSDDPAHPELVSTLAALNSCLSKPSEFHYPTEAELVKHDIETLTSRLSSIPRISASIMIGSIALSAREYADNELAHHLRNIVLHAKQKLSAGYSNHDAQAALNYIYSLREARYVAEDRQLFKLSEIITALPDEGCMGKKAARDLESWFEAQ